MKVSVSFSDNLVYFDFKPDALDEVLLSKTTALGSRGCFFQLPVRVDETKIHPDLLALSSLLLVYTFISSTLDIPFSVSQDFIELCRTNLNIDVRCSKGSVCPRIINDGRPALAYSGGVDSTAALALMPDDTAVYFLDRVQPSFESTLYNKFAAISAFSDLSDKRDNCFHVKSNMEYLRSKVGFTVDPLNVDVPHPVAVPMLLMADVLAVDAIAYGVVMESAYMVGHEKFEDYTLSDHYKKWDPFFKLVSCHSYFPTAGLTEIGTTIISEKSKHSEYVRSCMRGDKNSPCCKCIKCLRKTLLNAAVHMKVVVLDEIKSNLNSVEVMRNIYGHIYQHENVYRYIAQNVSSNEFLLMLQSRVVVDDEDTSWMKRWYLNAIDLIPAKYRNEYLSSVLSMTDVMTDRDISFVTSWDANLLGNKNEDALKAWQNYLDSQALSDTVKRFINKNFH
ncbi:MAG: hypothetical protein GY814_05340 [Gammaproteobacteria bacterium]|nr:hypothetical protein [Gammaproteobacteria bacterium]